MLFYSLDFWLVLPIGILMYHLTPFKYRWGLLLLGSIVFIGFISVSFLFYVVIFSIVNYYFGIILDKQNNPLKTKLYHWFLAVNIVQLVLFKYINFLIDNVNVIGRLFHFNIPYLNIIIPVGISYYTFQSIGYLINIYRNVEKPEKHFGYFLIYNLFFPKFMSGPIERSNKFFPQIHRPNRINPVDFEQGILLIISGFFKKLIIAERLSVIVNNVYGQLDHFTGYPLWVVMFLQTIYIYADFSGYTDIALGIGKLLGLNLTNNFMRPFFSPNVSVFWRRWHISLSSWFNDYMFKTLMFKKRKWGKMAAVYAVFLTFLVIGLWHGPNWTFVILGILQGIAINYEFFTKRTRKKIGAKIPEFWNKFLSRIITFTFMSFSLIFFFSPNMKKATYFVSHLFDFKHSKLFGNNLGLDHHNILIFLIAFFSLMLIEALGERGINLSVKISNKPFWLRWSLYYGIVLVIFLYSYFATSNFIYVRF